MKCDVKWALITVREELGSIVGREFHKRGRRRKYECLCRLETEGRCFSLNCEPNLVLESEKETKSRILKWACGLLKEEMKNKMSYISSLCISGRICNHVVKGALCKAELSRLGCT